MLNFSSPLFLYAGVSLLIPIILHLMKNEKALRLIFPTIRFLLKGKVPNKGKRKLRDLLLLLIRLLLLTLIILYFAKPQWIEKDDNLRGSQNITKKHQAVILLDLSASMHGWGNWERVKQESLKIVNDDKITELGLVSFGSLVNEQIPITTNKKEIYSSITNSNPSYLQGKVSSKILSDAINLFDKESEHHLYIISDFQITSWMIDDAKETKDIQLHLIDTAPNAISNIAIINGDSSVLSNNKLEIKATLKNFGLKTEKSKLTLEIGDKTLNQDIAIPAMTTHQTSFFVENPSTKVGVLSLGNDSYNIDNSYHLWLGKPAPIKISVLADYQDNSKKEELFFIEKAFSVITKNKQVDYSVIPCDVRNINKIKFNEFDGIILLGAGNFCDKKLFKQLKNNLNDGCVILFTPGKQPAKLFFELKRNNFMDIQFNKIEKFTRRNPSAIQWINPNSSFGELYKNTVNPDILLFPVFKYVSIETGKNIDILLKFKSKSPVIVKQNYKSGMIYASTIAFSSQWSDFQITSAFLPILTEIFSDKHIIRKNSTKKYDCNKFLKKIKSEAISLDIQPQVKIIKEIPYEINVSRQESIIEKQSLGVIRRVFSDTNNSLQVETEKDNLTYINLSQYCLLGAIIFLLIELLVYCNIKKK